MEAFSTVCQGNIASMQHQRGKMGQEEGDSLLVISNISIFR